MKRFFWRALKAVLLGGGLFVLWLFAVWPPPVWYRTHWPAETAFQSMRRHQNGPPLQRPGGRLYRPVPLDSISDWLPQTVMAGEDQRFRDHGGIDWVNLRRALGY
ncbi:MAG TPA: transglycosylase domain-containing protein, partial [Gemmatimonadales bacterium]